MDAPAGDRLSEAKYAELRSRLYRLDQSLSRHARSGDGLYDRHEENSRVERKSEKAAWREIRYPAVSQRGAGKWRASARRVGRRRRTVDRSKTEWRIEIMRAFFHGVTS